MSGIVGVFRRDGAPVDRAILGRMTDAMIRRGPDAQRIWADGPVGFGHAALFTTLEAERENQPTTLDGQVWITADARIDEWVDLRHKLEAKGRDLGAAATDVDLILHAYHVWGEDCVDHLIGDFSFAIWDTRQQKLFCARDHMGVKPFYYFLSDRLFMFASEVGALLAMPDVPRRINEGRIADFLVEPLEGIDKTSTFYLDIFRMPPAQSMVVSRNQHRARTYWDFDSTKEIRLGSDDEYAEAFLEVFTEAVSCRLRSPDRVGSMLSGGLDSSSIVGVARDLLLKSGEGPLKTFSAISEDEDGDRETFYIKAVLDQSGVLPHLVHPSDLNDYVGEMRRMILDGANPFDYAMHIPQLMYIAARRAGIKALLDGGDGEMLTYGQSYLTILMKQFRFRSALREAVGMSKYYSEWHIPAWLFLVRHGRSLLLPEKARRHWRVIRQRARLQERIKNTLISTDFAERSLLADRFERFQNGLIKPQNLKEYHLRRLEHTFLTVGLERYDRVAAAHSIEARHPYTDKRLLEFAFALPWEQKRHNGWTKIMVRRAMAGVLPDSVRWRPGGYDHLGQEFGSTRFDFDKQFIAKAYNDGLLRKLEKYINIEEADEQFQRGISCKPVEARFAVYQLIALAAWLNRTNHISSRLVPRDVKEYQNEAV